ncbi:MAG: prepilin-type N-terminal cleavage/methylation domain-containing protein [Gemmatimonadetes bacterium]|nr:prepilin-type N-terminal cleavage/methylation domain-containing protein [Gemmatimonadota bacterium]
MRGGSGASRRGFTLVEVLVVVMVMSIVTRIALPNVQEALLRARATEAVATLRVVEVAAREYNATTGAWPMEAPPGEVPPELVGYLPDGFDFQLEEYQLDWERWSLPDGLPSDPDADELVGVSLVTDREDLGLAVAELLGSSGWYTLGDHYTRLIDRT